MAVHRPNFSKKKSPSLPKKRVKGSLPQKRKVKKAKKEETQKRSLVRPFILFGLIFWMLFAQESRDVTQEKRSARFVAQEAQTTIFGDVGLTDEQMRRVALNILEIANGMTKEYVVADGLVLTCYILRYFAEIGEYELAFRDIMILVDAFENLTKTNVGVEVRDILEQTLKIRFGKREGKYFAKFYAKNPLKGIVIPINEVSEDPESSLREIRFVLIKDGAELNFEEVDTVAEKDKVRGFIKTRIKLLGVIDGVVDALNQIHEPLLSVVDSYLEDPSQKVPPLIVGMKGVSVEVDTTTLFEDITFDFNEAYAFPSIEKEGRALPSFVLGGVSNLLKLKVSIDQ